MEYTDKEFCIEVWGDYACFTRPELKVERVSYEVITPSVARAIFEAILWKPAIRWEVTKIEVMSPIKWVSVRRNEVSAVANRKLTPIFCEENRSQKNSLILKDVKYRLYAKLIYIPVEKRGDQAAIKEGENPMKYYEMFARRASNGQCFNQPYLGTREFSASFRLVDASAQLEEPIKEDRSLGIMLYDMDFPKEQQTKKSGRKADGPKPQPMFFMAEMKGGVIKVPSRDSKEVLR